MTATLHELTPRTEAVPEPVKKVCIVISKARSRGSIPA